MANAVGPVQVVNIPPAAQPAPVDPGELFNREVEHLRTACLEKHGDKGKVMGALIGLAMLVVAVWVGFAANSILLAIAVYLMGSHALGNLYHGLRNSEYGEARNALLMPSFRQYIRNRIELSIETIVTVHKQYKKHVVEQANLALAGAARV